MAELRPVPFGDLVHRLYREPALQGSLFELPRRRWYLPPEGGPDLGVRFHGTRAANPVGPAAGPHTQMAQNLLLSYAAGARILELKTVQVKDDLAIGRPCIDMTNVGYNIEWSQELKVAESLREYVAGAMLIEMFRRSPALSQGSLDGPNGAVIHDVSVGYDLEGIRSPKVRRFLDGMRDASAEIEALRAQIPNAYADARDAQYDPCLSTSITLSTFHGCPADEIERICEFLIGEHDYDVIVKMNPPMLGRERLEHLLHGVMGYTELRVNPAAYTSGLAFDDSIELCRRLTDFAAQRGRRLGAKFSNTLEVINHREFFSPNEKIMYLSGQPLHVITMALTARFREAVGPDVPISFSAGIDRFNFPSAVACDFVPVTISTDLLRPGGYGRLPAYLDELAREMSKCNAATVDDLILNRFGQKSLAEQKAAESLGANANADELRAAAVRWAGLLNTTVVAESVAGDPRYYADKNRKTPKRIDSQLETFDCITCDKCLPVCPNAANFTYPTPQTAFDYADVTVLADGSVQAGKSRRFEITETMQIACYADFCNECGNCDTFCPEYGGPYIKKPSFFGSIASWEHAAPRDGFVVRRVEGGMAIRGRIKGAAYSLSSNESDGAFLLNDGAIEAVIDAADFRIRSVGFLFDAAGDHRIDMGVFHTLRFLLNGVTDKSRLNQVNAAFI